MILSAGSRCYGCCPSQNTEQSEELAGRQDAAHRLEGSAPGGKHQVNRRPFRVTLFLWLVLLLTVWNGIRVWTAVAWGAALTGFLPGSARVYIALSGALWLLLGFVVLLAVLCRYRWTAVIVRGAAAAYTGWYWLDRWLSQEMWSNWPFALVLNILGLAFAAFASMALTEEAYERRTQAQEA